MYLVLEEKSLLGFRKVEDELSVLKSTSELPTSRLDLPVVQSS